jgi:hypothetical protein
MTYDPPGIQRLLNDVQLTALQVLGLFADIADKLPSEAQRSQGWSKPAGIHLLVFDFLDIAA